MEGPWLISYVILWILTVGLAFLTLSHSRLLGVMFRRIGPAPAKPLPDKFPLGADLPSLSATTLLAQPWSHSFPARNDMLAIFVSPQCQTCNELMPHVKDYVRVRGAAVDVVLLSVLADLAMNQAYVRFAALNSVRYLIAPQLAGDFGVPATPYAVKITRGGKVAAKGIVNNLEHLINLETATGSPID